MFRWCDVDINTHNSAEISYRRKIQNNKSPIRNTNVVTVDILSVLFYVQINYEYISLNIILF